MNEPTDIEQESELLAYQVIHFCDTEQKRPEVILNALVAAFLTVAKAHPLLTDQAGTHLITGGAHLISTAHNRLTQWGQEPPAPLSSTEETTNDPTKYS